MLRNSLKAIGLAAVAAVAMAQSAFAAVDWTDLTDGLVTSFEGAVTSILPTIGVIVAVFLAYKTIRKFVKA